MCIIAIFTNSPFDQELRIDCNMLKMNTQKDGEICILPNYQKSVFNIADTIIEASCGKEKVKVKISGNAIIKFNNNTLNCFGQFTRIEA